MCAWVCACVHVVHICMWHVCWLCKRFAFRVAFGNCIYIRILAGSPFPRTRCTQVNYSQTLGVVGYSLLPVVITAPLVSSFHPMPTMGITLRVSGNLQLHDSLLFCCMCPP